MALLHWSTIWIGELARVCALLALLFFPGWFILDLLRHRLPPALRQPAVLFAFPTTAIVLGVAATGLTMAQAGDDVFFLSAWLLYGIPAALAVFDRDRRARMSRELWNARFVLLLPALVAVCAICYAAVGLRSFDEVHEFTRLALRNVHDLPGDNSLGWLGSQTWRQHLAPNALFYYPWQIGDRGPLYSLLHLFLSRAIELDTPTYANYTRLGVVLNSLYLVPLFLWLTAVLERRTAWLCAALVGLNPWFFLNVWFTWPKLFGAHFLLAAMWLLWRHSTPKTSGVFVAAGALAGLSALAHAGSLFSLPVLLPITLLVFTRPWRSAWRIVLFPLTLFAVLEPWQLYKDWYSPESYSLFYLHYLDDKGYFTPLSDNVARFFREHPAGEQMAVRIGHLRELWWSVLDRRLIVGAWTRAPIGAQLYPNEFFYPWYTAGVVWFAWIVVALPIALALRAVRASGAAVARTLARPVEWLSSTRPGNPDVPVWPAVVFVAASLTINEFIRWRPPFSHELPYVELILLAALMLVGLARVGRAWLIFPVLGVIARQAFFFHESSRVSTLHLPAMDGFGRLYWTTMMLILALTLAPGLRSAARPVSAASEHR
jgi:hypothetical protein